MKVAIVCQPWDTVRPDIQTGSLPILVYQLVRRLAKSCDATVYCKSSWRRKSQTQDNVDYQYIPVGFDKMWLNLFEKFYQGHSVQSPLFASKFYYLGYVTQIALSIKGGNFDVVHIINFSQFAPIIRVLNPDVKIVLHMECDWLTQLDPVMIEERMSKVDLMIGCSEYISQRFSDKFPSLSKRSTSIPNGVDLGRFDSSQVNPPQPKSKDQEEGRALQLLYVGRVSPEKGIHVLLDAFSKVIQKYPNVQLKIIGSINAVPYDYVIPIDEDPKVAELERFYQQKDGSSWKEFISEWQASPLAENVTFTGPIPNVKLAAYYQQADIFIFPSVWHEPFGIPLVEAMAMGIPVIASRGGAFPEIVEDNQTGLLVERGDSDELAKAISTLLEDHHLRQSFGQAGLERSIKVFSYDRLAERFLEKYQMILSASEKN